MIAPPWLVETIAEWKPRARMGGAEWADKERFLSLKESPAAGQWRSLPWQVEILDALADPALDWIVILKGAQMGVSEVIRCAVGRWALLDPGDVLWVMTTEDAARKAMKKLQAMFESTPTLRPLVSSKRSDSTLLELVLTNGMRIVIGWAGSPQSLASDPFRYVIADEVAKYPTSAKGEPIIPALEQRTKVFGRRAKLILLSSPKHSDDAISTAHREVRDRRVFAVPCATCREVQAIDFSAVRWPGGEPSTAPTVPDVRARLADEIERDQSAWVECRACKGKILPHRAMWEKGARWIQEEPEAPTRRRAYHVPEFFHWETTLSGLAAKFLRCTTPEKLQGFYNGSLGTSYQSEHTVIPAALFGARAIFPARVVPSWATTVIATADTQLRGWWYAVRAWGAGARSRLLDWGWVETEEALIAQAVECKFEVEGSPGLLASPLVFAVDSGGGMAIPDGTRTKQVYQLVSKTPNAYALKGEKDREALQGSPWRTSRIRFTDERFGDAEIDLYLVNKNFYADQLSTLINAQDPVLWEECQGAESPTYSRQMASEHKVLLTTTKGSKWLWQKRSAGSENHMWDIARYQCWAAEMCRVEERKEATWSGTSVPQADTGWKSRRGGTSPWDKRRTS